MEAEQQDREAEAQAEAKRAACRATLIAEGYCMADTDGDCVWEACPQLRDGEPKATGRDCPRWAETRRRREAEEEAELRSPEPTNEALRARFEQARPLLGAALANHAPARLTLQDLEPGQRRVLVALGSENAQRFVYRCQGGCDRVVRQRGDWCRGCAAESRRVATTLALHAAIEAVNPEGSRAWCRPGDPLFEAAMNGTPEKPGIRRRYKGLARSKRDQILDDAILRAEWHHDNGTIALVGPTGIGKSVLLSALALVALDAAIAGRVERPEDFTAIAGIRYVSGLELAKDEKRHKLGDGESPLIRAAKRASILILDEVGYGDDAGDVSAVREIVRARYERGTPRPILFASGRRVEELNLRYGEATMRCVWGRGRIVDLHPPVMATRPA